VADVIQTFALHANDAPNVLVNKTMFELAERNLTTARLFKDYTLQSNMGKTLRIVRYNRVNLPLSPLVEGVPPDAVPMGFTYIDVTVEQWGIVALFSDMSRVTLTHPIMQIGMERCALAIAELIERENCKVLMTGTNVIYGNGGVASRDLIINTGTPKTDRMTTATALAATVSLRTKGAQPQSGQYYEGVMQPQQYGDVVGSDGVFQAASNYARVRKLEDAEIGTWMNILWVWGNFLPIFVGVAALDTAAVTTTKAKAVVADVGGSLITGNYKLACVARDITSDYERKISQASANYTVSASITTGSITVTAPTSVNYCYDFYLTTVGGTILYKVVSRLAASASVVITTAPVGTEVTCPVPPATGLEVFTSWVIGKDAVARVKLDGMSMQSYMSPDGPSWENILNQGRKLGIKMCYKAAVQEQEFMVRIETVSTYAASLPA